MVSPPLAMGVATITVALMVTGSTSAIAADPPGTLRLASGSSAHVQDVTRAIQTTRGPILTIGEQAPRLFDENLRPTSVTFRDRAHLSVCSDVVIDPDYDYLEWTNVMTGARGRSQRPYGREFLVAAPDGWLETEWIETSEGGSQRLHHIVAATGVDIVMGDVPGGLRMWGEAVCDGTGFLAETETTSTTTWVRGIARGTWSGAVSVVTTFAGRDHARPLAVRGTTGLFVKVEPNLRRESVVRFTGTGAPTTVLTVTDESLLGAALSPTGTVVIGQRGQVYYGTTGAMGVVANLGGDSGVGGAWASSTSAFRVFATGTTAPRGIYSVTSTGASRIWAAPPRAVSTVPVIDAPGRALWADDRRIDDPLWSRSLSEVGGLTAGPETLLATRAAGSTVGVNGRRTYWQDPESGAWTVHNGASAAALPTGGKRIWRATGHRVLMTDRFPIESSLLDLTTGSTQPGPEWWASALWGNTLVETDEVGNLVARDLRSGAQGIAVPVADVGENPSSLALSGDLLAWQSTDYTPENAWVTTARWRNLRTGLQQERVGAMIESVYGGLVAVRDDTGGQSSLVVRATDGSVVLNLGGPQPRDLDLGPHGVAWRDPTGEPRLSPVNQHLVPRHEGNPFAATRYTVGGTAWHGEWVFTEGLSTCSVVIKNSAAATVRTLPCNSAFAALGEAVVDWDGKSDAGAQVPVGVYTYRVNAGDADGVAVDSDGTTPGVGGSITVASAATVAAYEPVTPVRHLDTRSGVGAPAVKVPAGGRISLRVTGNSGIPANGVSAVVLNVTATAPERAGHLTVWPHGTTTPNASNLNFATGQTVPNHVIVKVGADGQIDLGPSGAVHLLADVSGYFPSGAAYTAVQPARILDTRTGLGAPKKVVGAGGKVDVTVRGVGGVPSTGVGAVVLNVTAVAPAKAGHLAVWPAASPKPNASNVNFVAGQTLSGLVLATVDSSGKVSISSSATTNLVADVAGWFPTSSDFSAVPPVRILDTRTGVGAAKAIVPAAGVVSLTVAGQGGVPNGVKAVVLNVTATGATRAGHASVYPSGVPPPNTSVVNYPVSAGIANSVIVRVGADGKVLLRVSASTHLIADVQGWFAT